MKNNTSIALTNLGKYNEGELVCKWLDLPATDEEIQAAFEAIGVADNTEYEEYFISDYVSEILPIGEYTNLEELNEQAEKIDNYSEEELEILLAILEATGDDIDSACETLEQGDYTYYADLATYADLAEELVNDGYLDVPERLLPYIDYDQIGRDLNYSGEFTQTANGFLAL